MRFDQKSRPKNIDQQTVDGFGEEWQRFDQKDLGDQESSSIFDDYFHLVDQRIFRPGSTALDVGCGSGRWASHVIKYADYLDCIDASPLALSVARQNLKKVGEEKKIRFIEASVGELPFDDSVYDFVYSLGVLHHTPSPEKALQDCMRVLKPGGTLLVYLYYRFDNRPLYFKLIWMITDRMRKVIHRAPKLLKIPLTSFIALFVYLPLARICKILKGLNLPVKNIPLSYYSDKSFYTMRTDSYDRFCTKLESRFTKQEIINMFSPDDISYIKFSDRPPFWTFVVEKK